MRPDINPNFAGSFYTHGSTSARAARFFNPNAFLAPAYGTVGNLARDILTGPGYRTLDLSLSKVTEIAESTRLQFRAEFFNVLNHTNLQTPNAVVYSSGPTQGSASSDNCTSSQSFRRRRHLNRGYQPSNPTQSQTPLLTISTSFTERVIEIGFVPH